MKRPYTCSIVEIRVFISSQTFTNISGIGDNSDASQTEYQCSHEDDCQHRTKPDCPVRRLNLHE